MEMERSIARCFTGVNRSLLSRNSTTEGRNPSRRQLCSSEIFLYALVVPSARIHADWVCFPQLNPKNWSPTQLSLYLSTTTFSLHPLLANDITAFIKSSFLSGRVFLRLQDVDFEEMGVNVKWRTVLGEARVTLKRESATQGGKIWGFEGGRAEEGFAVSEEVATDGEDEVITREEWKKSWKKIKGKTAKSRGRVKGMASVFESDSPTVNRHHHRSDSATSSISASSSSSSIVEKPEIDEHSSSPTSTPMTSDLSNSTTRSKASGSIPPVPPLDGSYQSAISQHTSSNINPYGLVRKPSAGSRRSISGARVGGRAGSGFVNTVAASGSRISTNNVDVAQWQDSLPQGVMEEGDETVKSSSSAGRESKGTLQQLFNLEIKKSSRRSFPPRDEKETSREREKAEEKDSFDVDIEERDVLTRKFGNGTGSMVLVKRSQLEELGRRMEEGASALLLSRALADQYSRSRITTPACPRSFSMSNSLRLFKRLLRSRSSYSRRRRPSRTRQMASLSVLRRKSAHQHECRSTRDVHCSRWIHDRRLDRYRSKFIHSRRLSELIRVLDRRWRSRRL